METIAFGIEEFAPMNRARPLRIRIVNSIAPSPVAADLQTDSELFERFRTGDQAAFTELFKRHHARVYRYCVKLLHDHATAEDISQAMWERVIDRAGEVAAVRNVPGFLFRIARNLALDHLKHRKIIASLESADPPTTGSSELPEREQIVLECLEALPLPARELLILHYYSGYSFEEIAAMLGKKPNAIWTRASRARAELKASIEKRLREKTIGNDR